MPINHFSVMASGLLESTGDFLESELDQRCSDLHNNTDQSDDLRYKLCDFSCKTLKCNVMAFCFEQSSFTSLFEQMCAFVNTLCNPNSMIILIINISR